MARTATLIVVAAALLIALVVTLPSPASTPMVRATHMGKTAQQWYQIAVRRRLARDWLQKRLTSRVLEVRALRKVKAPPVRDVQYAIHLAATTYGVSETDMNRVASCESGHSATAANGRYRGVYQEGPMFENSRFGRAGFSVWDPVANAMNAAETVSREGWSQWTCKP